MVDELAERELNQDQGSSLGLLGQSTYIHGIRATHKYVSMIPYNVV